MNAPRTVEGRQLWDLVRALDGQMRIAPSGAVLGWDMTAALTLGQAMGLPGALLANVLPEVERVMAARLRAAQQRQREGG